jgi:hypothetical protein
VAAVVFLGLTAVAALNQLVAGHEMAALNVTSRCAPVSPEELPFVDRASDPLYQDVKWHYDGTVEGSAWMWIARDVSSYPSSY